MEPIDQRPLASLSWMLAYCVGVAVLASGCDSDVYPLGNVILTGPSGTASHIIDNNHTVAFPHSDLQPPSTDPPNTTHTLTFIHTSGETPRQEIVGFDLDYSEPILVGQQPTIDYVPTQVEYVSVPAGTSETYAFDSAPTAHVVRYWHGRCAVSTPWSDIFDAISDGVFQGIAEGAKESNWVTSIERLHDVFQPYFIGAYATIEHGFSFEAHYRFNAGPLAFRYYMNPAYRLDIQPENGLVSVTSVHQGVVPSQSDLQDALENRVPQGLSQTINNTLTFSLQNPVIPTPCDPAASVSQQQEFCFSEAVKTPDDPGYLWFIFSLGFEQAGFDEATAQWAAAEMLEGLEAKNFTCINTSAGRGSCAIHPVILRINVLPDELEFVFVADDDPFEKVFFYEKLPIVVKALLPETTVPQFCFQPFVRPGGAVTMIAHDYQYEGL